MNSRREQREVFRQALRRAREASGLSQRVVGEAVGRTGSAVWQWEEGRGAPDQATVASLEAVLELELDTLARRRACPMGAKPVDLAGLTFRNRVFAVSLYSIPPLSPALPSARQTKVGRLSTASEGLPFAPLGR